MPRFWDEIKQNRIDALALATAIVALLVSVAGFVVSRDAQNQASAQFRQERQLVLTGEFKTAKDGACSDIKVKPIGSDFRFQKGKAILPSQIYKEIISITNDGEFLNMGSVCLELQNVIKDKIKWKKDNVQIVNRSIPLIIQSFYAVKGESYTDISLYALDTLMIVSDKEHEFPKVTFEGLSFFLRLPFNEPVNRKMLNELADTEFRLKPRGP